MPDLSAVKRVPESMISEGHSDSNGSQSNDKVYNEDYLGITEKGKLKWNGSFEGLRNLVMTQHISAESWTSPGGDCKLCEDNGFTIRWYSTSGWLTFGGDKSDEVKTKLLLLAQKGDEARIKSTCDKEQEDNLHTLQANTNSPLGTVITQASQATTQQVNYSQIEFKNKMEKFIESTNLKIDNLASEVNELKMAKSNSTLKNNDESVATNEIANLLMKENQDLRDDNKILREKNTNMSYTVADLNSKIQDLESEKQSLKTTLKILYADLENAEGNMQPPNDKSKAQQHLWVEAHGTTKSDPTNPELINSNKYSALHIEDDGEVDNSDDKILLGGKVNTLRIIYLKTQ